LVAEKWPFEVGKITVGLASHWPCVTDPVVYPLTGSTAIERKLCGMAPLYLVTFYLLRSTYLLTCRHKRFYVSVDDVSPTASLLVPDVDERRNVFTMFGPLYVGGLPGHLLHGRRPHGLLTADVSRFVGCLATLTVNGQLHDPTASLPPSAVSGCRS